MSLLFIDGFGGGDSATNKWDSTSDTYTVANSTPRVNGGYYAQMGTSPTLYKSFTAASQIFVGFGFQTNGSVFNLSLYGDAGVTQHLTVTRNAASGFLELRRGSASGTLLATGTTQIVLSAWFYLEISATISDTVGVVNVRLNGSTSNEITFSGDTKNAGTNSTIDKFSVSFGSGGGTKNLADVYICNSLGTTNNTFLGDVTVRTLTPTGNGNYSQLTNSSGNSTNNYTYVDEHPYSATDYVGSPTTGLKDTYALSDLPAGVTTIYGVQLNGSMLKSDATLAQARNVLRTASTDYGGTTRALTTTVLTYVDIYETNPNTSAAWTPTQVNNLESGMEIM